jgi:hypothetical protein
LSQKPFWSMFSDPYALLTCQELALDMLADVVSELVAVRTVQRTLDATAEMDNGDNNAPVDSTVQPTRLVTVFDFTHILSVTESRVEHDLLGAGPLSVTDLRRIHGHLQTKYQRQLQAKLDRMVKKTGAAAPATPNKEVVPPNSGESAGSNLVDPREGGMDQRPSGVSSPSPPLHEKVLSHATGLSAAATGFLNQAVHKLNPLAGFRHKNRAGDDGTLPPPSSSGQPATESTESIDFAIAPSTSTAPLDNATSDAMGTTETVHQVDLLNDFDEWIGAAMEQPNTAVSLSGSAPLDQPMTNFSIGADEDEFLDPTMNVPL